jgi:hypothetical protein
MNKISYRVQFPSLFQTKTNNMTPKEKAEELFHKFYIHTNGFAKENAKMFAFIAVEEIINSNPYKLSLEGKFLTEHITYDINFWEEVKKEIENI